MTTPTPCAVQVCPERDIECGNNSKSWCATCPKRGADKATDELKDLLTAATNASFDCGAHDCDDDDNPDVVPYEELARIANEKREAVLGFFSAYLAAVPVSEPVDMILHCPSCGLQHIDAPETHEVLTASGLAEVPDWTNPPHRSHLCHGCSHIWRPADVPTNGVAAIATKGSADSPAANAGVLSNGEIHTLRRLIECAEVLNTRPRPMCRDCADENETCPNSGLECDMRKLFADAKALHNKLASPATAPAPVSGMPDLAAMRAVLQQFVDHHTKPAGLTLETVIDKKCFGEFLENIESSEKAIVAKARALLNSAAPAPSRATAEQTAEINAAVKAGRIVFEPGWNDPRPAPAPTEQAGEAEFIRAAQNIIARGFQPNGPSDATTIGSLIALFTSPDCRAALAARQAPDSRNVWTDEQRENHRKNKALVYRCTICCAKSGEPHLPSCPEGQGISGA